MEQTVGGGRAAATVLPTPAKRSRCRAPTATRRRNNCLSTDRHAPLSINGFITVVWARVRRCFRDTVLRPTRRSLHGGVRPGVYLRRIKTWSFFLPTKPRPAGATVNGREDPCCEHCERHFYRTDRRQINIPTLLWE